MKDILQILLILFSFVHSSTNENELVDMYLEYSPVLAVAHLTCTPSSIQKRSRDRIKAECCDAIVDKVSHLCFEYISSSRINNNNDDYKMNALCKAALSKHIFSLQEPKESILESLNSKCHQLLTLVPVTNDDNNWDDNMLFYMNRPIFYEMEEHSHTPCIETHLQKYLLRNGVRDWTATISPFSTNTLSKDDKCTLTATLHSDVSSTGGMLRKFPQSIRLKGHVSNYSQSNLSYSKLNGKILLHLPISEGTFLDLDDPFQDYIEDPCSLLHSDGSESLLHGANVTCHVSVISPSATRNDSSYELARIIDIEQPAFVSPQHVVLIQLDFQIEFGSISVDSQVLIDLNFRFVPLLHIRYLMPIGNKMKERRQSLFIPAPFFFEAVVEFSTDEEHNESGKNFMPVCFDYNHTKTFYAKDQLQESFHPIYIQVSSGYDIHHDYVAFITTIVSLVGAWKLLNSMSRISLWI